MNNSMFTTEPPCIIIEPANPIEAEEEMIRNHIDEENITNGFIDIEAVRVRELIQWAE